MRRLFLAVAVLLATAVVGLAETMPTMDAIRQMEQDSKWDQLLSALGHVLALKGDAAKPYDRYQLMMYRGEANLSLKRPTYARESYDEALKLATTDGQIAAPKAYLMLLSRVRGMIYTPKAVANAAAATQPTTDPSTPTSYDISDPAQRKLALAALYADELTAARARQDNALKAKQLPDILRATQALGDLRYLELATSDADPPSDSDTHDMLKALADHAKDLMDKEVDSMQKDVDAIDKSANEEITVNETVTDPNNAQKTIMTQRLRKRGLDNQQSTTLQTTIQTADKITLTAKQFDDALGSNSTELADTKSNADKLSKDAQRILTTNYDPNGPGRNNGGFVGGGRRRGR